MSDRLIGYSMTDHEMHDMRIRLAEAMGWREMEQGAQHCAEAIRALEVE